MLVDSITHISIVYKHSRKINIFLSYPYHQETFATILLLVWKQYFYNKEVDKHPKKNVGEVRKNISKEIMKQNKKRFSGDRDKEIGEGVRKFETLSYK